MNPKTKNLIELVISGFFVLCTVPWPYEALMGEKEWWPYGIVGLVAMLYWMQVFSKRWARI